MKNLKLYEDFHNESDFTPRDEMMDILKKKYPNMWFKPAEEFSKEGHAVRGIWTGAEGETFIDADKKIPAFNPVGSYSYNHRLDKDYDNEVHKSLAKFLKEHGYYAEFYDDATVFLWPIHNYK